MTGSTSRVAQASDPEPGARNSEGSLTVSAYAKINLTLEVLGRRPDGLHEVATLMQTISLADHLRFTPSSNLRLRHRGLKPTGEDNLILRAAGLLLERTKGPAGFEIECTKHIPIASGLGGGSADAAATLRALNALLKAPLDVAELVRLSAELGADVPFAVQGGTALGTGTGSEITPLPDAPAHWVVLVPISADDSSKTAEMYARLAPGDLSDGAAARTQATAIGQGRLDYAVVGSAFSRAAAARWPGTAAALDALRAAEALAVSVSGAGPSVFGLYATRAAALGGLARVRAESLSARLYRFVNRLDVLS